MYTVLFGRSELDGNVEELRPKLNAVIAACEGIIDSQSLTQFLGFTLRTGNFINTVTSGRPVAVLRGGGRGAVAPGRSRRGDAKQPNRKYFVTNKPKRERDKVCRMNQNIVYHSKFTVVTFFRH